MADDERFTPTAETVRMKKVVQDFANKWLALPGDEKQETSRFWLELLQSVLGVRNPMDVVRFEERVRVESSTRFIDAYLPDTRVIIEQKSAGVKLDEPQLQSGGAVLTPYEQAKRYSDNLPYDKRALWILTCNFREFRIHDMNSAEPAVPASIISLNELPEQWHLLRFLTDSKNARVEKEKRVSMQAGALISRIYTALLARIPGANDAALQMINRFCVRLVFCLYAEDAGLFAKDALLRYMRRAATPEGKRALLLALFRALDLPHADRDPFDAALLAFPYVNGGLFAGVEKDSIPPLNAELCNLIENEASAGFNWCDISPTIFGGLFESTLNPETRRSGGMHYTSIENIHKVIDPLFLDALKEELRSIVTSAEKSETRRAKLLTAFQEKLASLTFLDPACGSGNFLTETYISLRRLENETLRYLANGQGTLGGELSRVRVSMQQFYGIEINDFAVSVAKTALWIANSQMWQETQEFTTQDLPDFLPLENYENIREGNALQLDWSENLPNRHVDYIIGNPPFIGYSNQTKEQKEDMKQLLGHVRAWGKLDFVGAWFYKTAHVMKVDPVTRTAFVSTNSIVQGEQASSLWKPLMQETGAYITFAYRTFKWTNEADDMAAVHCVIIGMSTQKPDHCTIYDGSGTPHHAAQINGYLMDAPCVFVGNRNHPICSVPSISAGNRPADGGHLIIEEKDYADFITREPRATKFIKRLMGSDEFIKGKKRYCLWLVNANPTELRSMPAVMHRLEACRQNRLHSPDAGRRKLADTPSLFRETKNPASFLAIPEVSSERREYVPMAFLDENTIASNLLQIIPGATIYHFGILTSTMHAAWMRAVAGRLKSDYRYSGGVVYNNFPWPSPTDAQRAKIETCAQTVLDARAIYPESSLADLYDPLLMPPELRRAHKALDAAVDAAYNRTFTDETDRVAHLFELYRKLTSTTK